MVAREVFKSVARGLLLARIESLRPPQRQRQDVDDAELRGIAQRLDGSLLQSRAGAPAALDAGRPETGGSEGVPDVRGGIAG